MVAYFSIVCGKLTHMLASTQTHKIVTTPYLLYLPDVDVQTPRMYCKTRLLLLASKGARRAHSFSGSSSNSTTNLLNLFIQCIDLLVPSFLDLPKKKKFFFPFLFGVVDFVAVAADVAIVVVIIIVQHSSKHSARKKKPKKSAWNIHIYKFSFLMECVLAGAHLVFNRSIFSEWIFNFSFCEREKWHTKSQE